MRNSLVIHRVKITSEQKRLLQCIVLFLFACHTVGCASMFDSSAGKNKSKDKKKESWSLFKKKEYQEPRSLVSTWTEDTLIQPGKPVTRGFGGRFYFYNDRSQVIPVDGELVVYGFDDGKNPEVSHPNAMTQVSPSPSDLPSNLPNNLPVVEADKKFRFTAEQFTQHFSQGDLGASYSVWIPWDAAGGPQRKITLIPCFVTKEGRTVRGDASKQVLSGKPAIVSTKDTSGNPIQLASANLSPNSPQASMAAMLNSALEASPNPATAGFRPVTQPNMQPLGLSTTTIRLGPSSSLSNPMTIANQGSNNLGTSLGYAANAPQNGSVGNFAFSTLNTQNNSPSMQNQIQTNHYQPLLLPPAHPPQQPLQQPNGQPPGQPAVAPVQTQAVQTPAAFHSPLSQTKIPPTGHSLPPTGWMNQ